MRINIELEDLGAMIDAYEAKHQSILDEMMALGVSQDELTEAVESLRQVDSKVKRFTKIFQENERRILSARGQKS